MRSSHPFFSKLLQISTGPISANMKHVHLENFTCLNQQCLLNRFSQVLDNNPVNSTSAFQETKKQTNKRGLLSRTISSVGQLFILYIWLLGNISLETLLIDYGVFFRDFFLPVTFYFSTRTQVVYHDFCLWLLVVLLLLTTMHLIITMCQELGWQLRYIISKVHNNLKR